MSWRDELKVGDTVIEECGRHYAIDHVCKVERITKTQVILDSGLKFRKEDGKMVGSDVWTSRYIQQATTEKINSIKAKKEKLNLVSLCKNTNWSALSTESLRKIVDIVKCDVNR